MGLACPSAARSRPASQPPVVQHTWTRPERTTASTVPYILLSQRDDSTLIEQPEVTITRHRAANQK
jgi:hypothetical protein